MKIIQTDDFKRAFRRLSKEIQRLYLVQELRFKTNSCDTRFDIKEIKELPHAFSFRVTRNYRVFFYLHTLKTAVFFDIDHRKDSYRRP